jgi:membrane-associated phospholipid phosphatase
LLADVVVPVAAQLSDGFDRRFANATLIYAEAHAMNALLTNAVKVTVRRPRPYTRSSNPLAEEFVREQRSDAYMSFFSGHASTTHTAAMSGSILYAMRTTDAYARHVMFGFEFLLAGLTSQLRVRAGRHYRSDVWTGTLVGMGIGLGVPALHGLPLSRIRATEWATGVGSTLLSIALTEAVDLSAVFDWLAPDKPTPLEPVDPEHTQATSFWLMPQAWPAGALIGGEF